MSTNDGAKESRLAIRLKLVFMAVGGGAVMYVSQFLGGPTWVELVRQVGETALIAALLGLTLDVWLKKQLFRDAFEASIGYVLPPEFRDELRWMYGQTVLCTKHVQTMRLERLSDGHVLLSSTVQRTFKNISDKRTVALVVLGIDEWFRGSRESRIVEYGYEQDGESFTFKPSPSDLIQNPVPGWSIKKVEREIDPGREAMSWFTVEEIHDVNGQHVGMFRVATKDPVVTINAPDDIGVHVFYGSRARDEAGKKGEQTFPMPGLMLPFQAIYVRWWDRKAEANWRKIPAEG